MEQRTVERFRKRAILIHWLHAASFAVMLITGTIMFFDLTSMEGGHQIRKIQSAPF
jgi:cytochrome b subunit of formate dehydrogenase